MKDKKYHSVETVSKSNRKIGERGKIDTPNPQIHDRPFSSLRTGTSIKSGGVEIFFKANYPEVNSCPIFI
jgi:hypothetical protein